MKRHSLIGSVKLVTNRTRENHPVRSIRAFSRSGRLVRMKTLNRFLPEKYANFIFKEIRGRVARQDRYTEENFATDAQQLTAIVLGELK